MKSLSGTNYSLRALKFYFPIRIVRNERRIAERSVQHTWNTALNIVKENAAALPAAARN